MNNLNTVFNDIFQSFEPKKVASVIDKATKKCACVNVEIGSYDNQVELPAPPQLIKWAKRVDFSLGGDRLTVCVDVCLKDEILHLWSLGITTTGCCCGHNKVESYIGVEDTDIPKMKELGYEVRFNPCGPEREDSFIPKTI